ncbi:MAG TPA: glycosyltransferase family 2 protein [archaeon]|nr:glycosyltransferase family 2 protein [archaeon]
MTQYSISIIVPVYNEAVLLEESVDRIVSFLSTHFTDFEVLLVESGSTDGTAEICDSLVEKFAEVQVVHEGARNGFGSAIKLGYKKAAKDLVCLETVDFPYQIETILHALPLMNQYDCVLSYRSRDCRNSYYRKVQSFVYNSLVRLLLGLRVKHINSAFKMFKRELIQSFDLISNGWFIDAEIVYRVQAKKIKYAEIPVEVTERIKGKSNVSLSAPVSALKELVDFLKKIKSGSIPR